MIPPSQNYAGNYGNYGSMSYGAPMTPPYPPSSPMDYGTFNATVPQTGFSTFGTQIPSTTNNMMSPMMNQGYTASNGGPAMMGGYETGMMNPMGGYGPTMANSTLPPSVPPVGVGCAVPAMSVTTTNSNSRVLVGNSNSRVIIAPPIYNKAVIQPRPVQTRVEYIPYETREIVYDTVEKRQVIPIQKTITEYQQLKHIETIPVEKAVTDFYAVEYLTQFMPTTSQEKVVDYVQQEVINQHVNYRPVDTQRVIPNPDYGYSMSQSSMSTQGMVTPPGAMGYGQNVGYGQGVGYTGPPVVTNTGIGSIVEPVNPMATSVRSNYNNGYMDPTNQQFATGMRTQPLF